MVFEDPLNRLEKVGAQWQPVTHGELALLEHLAQLGISHHTCQHIHRTGGKEAQIVYYAACTSTIILASIRFLYLLDVVFFSVATIPV